ncbi:DUF6461 domain-containing protein [Streptomyces griseoaurantiacus]|uniref:DUF6461 domain-containing protein n=1 Tax=Streptomyces griseoaurantiacus TaxID=68213 RepID=UPI00345FB7ED
MSDWTWATDSRYPSFCLVLFRDVAVSDLLEVYGISTGATQLLHLDEVPYAFPLDTPGSLVRCGTSGRWSFFFESSGSQGADKRMIERVKTEEALQIIKGGDGTNAIAHFTHGRQTEHFEPGRPAEVYGDGPHTLSAQLVQAASEKGSLWLDECLDIIGTHLGFSIPRHLLDGPLVTFFVPAQ